MKDSKKKPQPNRLINETSPYLLQHAYNPVDWHAWNDETLQKAKLQNKMLLISIGYSACHWCHVMEHECFENKQLAKLMNDSFICVKVDREERPDVDAVYMNAVQLIHGNGGWPLNCFALPDGTPFYGGTYFTPSKWEVLIKNIAGLFLNRKAELVSQAQQILEGINSEDLIKISNDDNDSLDKSLLDKAYQKWKIIFDLDSGGSKGAPKFPMPSNLNFLLKYSFDKNNAGLDNYIKLSLDKMAMGGIYDQLGGGFSRYSVDAAWKVPHFEKMLYDNAQLISLYTEAYQIIGEQRFLEVAKDTADFVLNELTSSEGFFYSALDADSEGEEGKFYVWTKSEFDEILGGESPLISAYFGMDGEALWEDGKNVLMLNKYPEEFLAGKNIETSIFKEKLSNAKQKLLRARNQRVKPGLDDKSLTSWNALTIKALAQLSVLSGEDKYLEAATKAMQLIGGKLCTNEGAIFHNYKNGIATINGFLEDYAFAAEAAIELYQVSMDEKWIAFARQLADYALANFYDGKQGLFWFTHKNDTGLIARKKELYDNVIPSSNSAMGIVLFKLSKFFANREFEDIAKGMAQKMAAYVKKHPSSFSNWATLVYYLSGSFSEVIVAGPGAKQKLKSLYKYPNPRKIVAGAVSQSGLPVFAHRFKPDKTMIYVCSGNVCREPVEDLDKAFAQMK